MGEYVMQLNWVKCQDNQWCKLLTLNLNHLHFQGLEGVYIIWHGGQNPWTVYVGQGSIGTRLEAHRRDPEILRYASAGLFVTWAMVDAQFRDGIELFLAEKLQPGVGSRHPQATRISVNLPW